LEDILKTHRKSFSTHIIILRDSIATSSIVLAIKNNNLEYNAIKNYFLESNLSVLIVYNNRHR